MSIYIGDKEIKNLYAGGSTSVSDMQGPCPDGFHVPLSSEWQAVYNAGISLGAWTSSNGEGIKTYLKMPYSGERTFNTGNITAQNSYGYYRLSTVGDAGYAYAVFFRGNSNTTQDRSINYGYSIRPYKNSPIKPDSSRIALKQGTGNAGIYHNSTLGLISISSDGTTWITISDKNLGATTVYNDGDTLSETNCGKYYQRGNNYGFPRTGSVTTSSTKVDASTYGPGNYYSNSTFITSYPRDSSSNQNLRGGVSQGTTETGAAKAVYLGENKVRPIGPDKDYLCFTAEQANSTVKLKKKGSAITTTLETSTDGKTWSDYTIGNTITLTNIGDKVYWRNKSETAVRLSSSTSNYYNFVLTGLVGASGDITSLLCKNLTDTISGGYCFCSLFNGATSLTSSPSLPATTIPTYCYYTMFKGCSNLETIPKLPATAVQIQSYYQMFQNCSKIKLSSTRTGAYQTEYRIPTTGTGTTASNALSGMFASTGGTFTSNPSINTTYYTSNIVV